jgi:tetratricopeptide (TPR) repeat protein
MKDLSQICRSLSGSEIRFIRNYYRSDEDKKRLKLFNLILDSKTVTEEDASKKIYNAPPDTAFSHLKSRLKKDILTILLLEDGFKHSSSPYRQAEVNCRRLLIEGDILLKRGVYKPAIKLLTKASRIAGEHELPLEKILIEDILRTHIGFKSGIEVYQSYSESIKKQLSLLQDILNAKELYNNILLPNLHKNNREGEYITLAKQTYERLEEAFQRTGSPNVGYLYHLTGMYYFDFVKDHKNALLLALNLLDLVEKQPSIYSSVRVANVNLQIANILMGRYHFDEASSYAQRAVEHFTSGLMNELVALEHLFYSHFRAKDFGKAEEIMEKAFRHPMIRSSALTYAKWVFAKAGLEFSLGNHDRSQDALFEDNTLLNDKSGWLFGVKLLEIMNFIELGQHDLIYFRIESLRKLLQRQKDKKVLRIKTVFQILSTFEKTGGSFEKTWAEETDKFELLQRSEGDYYWNPLGYEVIRFDDWFASKFTVNSRALV